MMTNIQMVKYAISKVSKFDGCVVTDQIRDYLTDQRIGTLSNDQIRRSMRDMKGTKKISPDTWKIKGRKTPVKTFEDTTYPRMIWNSEKQGTYRKHKSVTKSTNPIYVGSVN